MPHRLAPLPCRSWATPTDTIGRMTRDQTAALNGADRATILALMTFDDESRGNH